MKHSPLDKDLSALFPPRPPVDPDFAALEVERSISRIRGAASQVEESFEVSDTIQQHLQWLLKHCGTGVPAFVGDVLYGGLGELAAKAAWNLFATGVPVARPNGSDVRVSVGAYCLANGSVAALQALIERGLPQVVHPGMFGRLAPTKVAWLTMLCTTSAERSHAEFPGLGTHGGLVELAAVNHDHFPAHADAAMELAWSVDPEQPGFAALAEDSSAPGAVVRQFLMSKQLQLGAATSASLAANDAAPAPIDIRRARRASI